MGAPLRGPPHSSGIALGLTLLIASCSGGDAVEEDHLDALPVLTVEPGMRIGDRDDPDLGFSWVTEVHVDERGRIYVGEGSVPEIRVYGADGSILRRIGRRGEGPGEFQWPPGFGIRGDTVWAWDAFPRRLTLFDRSGEVLSTARVEGVSVPLPASYGYVLPGAMRADGTFASILSIISGVGRDDPATGVQPTDSIPVPIVRFGMDGTVLDTIGWTHRPPPRMWRPPSEEGPAYQSVDIEGRRVMAPRPPSTLPTWLALPDGYLAVATPLPSSSEEGVVTVTRVGLASDTVYHRTLRYTPRRYTDEELDTIAMNAVLGSGGMVPAGAAGGAPPPPEDMDAAVRRVRAAMEFPEHETEIQTVHLARDESLWLRRRDAEGPTARWVLLDPEGAPRGQVELPATARIVWSREDTFWTAEPDEYDVPWLVRYEVR